MTAVFADASSTVGLAIILVVTGSMIWVTLGALERRRRAARVRSGPLGRGDMTARAPNTAAQIDDAGQVPMMELLGALRVREADELDEEGEFNIAPGLGLKLHEGDTGYRGSSGRPTVMEGSRNGHQAFIRLGHLEGRDSPGIGFRNFRYDLWLLERLATATGAEPLPDKRLRSDWHPPYGMGRWAPKLFGE